MSFRRIPLLILVGLAVLLSACEGLAGEPRVIATIVPQTAGNDTDSQQDIAEVMALGGTVWANNCAECHGQTGLGTEDGAPLPDLTDYTDDVIMASITNGKGDDMPAFGDRLTEDELAAAMTYSRMISLAVARGMIGNPEDVQPAETQAATAEVVTGVVTGQIASGTTGAAVPAEITLSLHIIKSEFTEETIDAAAASDGSYRFEGVPFDSSYQYVITAPYGSVRFVSEIVTVDPAQPALNLPITLYESGAPESAIQISAISSQSLLRDNSLQIIQIVSFINTSDRVYFNTAETSGTSVSLRLPPNASILNSVSDSYVISDDGNQITSTRPVLPGKSQVMHLAYSIPYSDQVVVEQVLDYPLEGQVEVAVATDGLRVSGEGFDELGQVAYGERAMMNYGGAMTLPAGASLSYEVSGTPVTAPADANPVLSSPVAYILIGAGIGSLVIATILTVRDRLNARKRDSKATINALMEQIAALDSQHDAGKINLQEYERQRSALKARLSALMKSQ